MPSLDGLSKEVIFLSVTKKLKRFGWKKLNEPKLRLEDSAYAVLHFSVCLFSFPLKHGKRLSSNFVDSQVWLP